MSKLIESGMTIEEEDHTLLKKGSNSSVLNGLNSINNNSSSEKKI